MHSKTKPWGVAFCVVWLGVPGGPKFHSLLECKFSNVNLMPNDKAIRIAAVKSAQATPFASLSLALCQLKLWRAPKCCGARMHGSTFDPSARPWFVGHLRLGSRSNSRPFETSKFCRRAPRGKNTKLVRVLKSNGHYAFIPEALSKSGTFICIHHSKSINLHWNSKNESTNRHELTKFMRLKQVRTPVVDWFYPNLPDGFMTRFFPWQSLYTDSHFDCSGSSLHSSVFKNNMSPEVGTFQGLCASSTRCDAYLPAGLHAGRHHYHQPGRAIGCKKSWELKQENWAKTSLKRWEIEKELGCCK